jgi:mono/diheme cytochrome c family protein
LLETYTGDGPISYWNVYVAVTQMGGKGSFFDPRIGVDVYQETDLVAPRLPALHDYQMALETPTPPDGSFDAAAAERGEALFNGAATCSSCHAGAVMTDAPQLHDPEDIVMDPVAAERSATGRYRTTPLRALFQHAPYFHDGSAATLQDVVEHYDNELGLGLTADEMADLVEYLSSI